MHFRTPKGDFWQHIATSLKWRQKWKFMAPHEREGYSVNGWCPWLGGSNCVRAWRASTEPDPVRAEVFGYLKEGETREFIEALMQCCEEIEAQGGLPRFKDDPKGRVELRNFQKLIYGSFQ